MKNLKVTVAVCAYNEDQNIKKFLKSVLIQREKGFMLEKILVYSDGSTDNTVDEVKSLGSKKIKLVEVKKRKGKSALLSDIYKNVDSDFLIQTDADVIFRNPSVISEMVKPFKNKKVGLVGGDHRPTKGITFTEKAVSASFEAYIPFRHEVRGGNNLFSVAGCILCMRKDFFKKLEIPKSMINNDVFTYYSCLNMGYKYKYAPKALVYFRQPQSLKDQIKQNTRFISGHMRMYKYFPKELVQRESHIPIGLKYKYMIRQFLKTPVLSAYIFIVNKYCVYSAKKVGERLTGKWYMATTTKKF